MSAERREISPIDAAVLAFRYMQRFLKVTLCYEVPQGLYGFNMEAEYLFAVEHSDVPTLGSTEYLGVSKVTGQVRLIGRAGE